MKDFILNRIRLLWHFLNHRKYEIWTLDSIDDREPHGQATTQIEPTVFLQPVGVRAATEGVVHHPGRDIVLGDRLERVNGESH